MNNERCSKIILETIISWACIFAFLCSYANAQPIVIGEGIRFSPANPKPGQTVFMDIRFRVEGSGSPIPIDFSILEATRTPDSAHPSLSGHTYAPSVRSYTIRAGHTLANPIYPRLCFNVYAHFPGTGLRSSLLINNACLGARRQLASSGTGHTVTKATTGSPGTPTIVRSTIIGRHVELVPTNLHPVENTILFWTVADVLGEDTGGGLILEKDGIGIVSTYVAFDRGPNRKAITEIISRETTGTDLFPGTSNYAIKINFPTSDDRHPPSYLLIDGIRAETIMHVLNEGTGQRITLPDTRKVIPRHPVVMPARPGI